MRLNQYLALHTGLSRRAADRAVTEGRVEINGTLARLGDIVVEGDRVALDGLELKAKTDILTVMLNKPAGYVVSRDGQGSRTIYDLLLPELHNLKPVGRLDKDSSGLLLLTNDGQLANRLTHPRYEKQKIYSVILDKPLTADDKAAIVSGVKLNDGPSALKLAGESKEWQVKMSEGRNRQIRRTFEALGYKVTKLHRTNFGPFELGSLPEAQHQEVSADVL